MAIFGTRPEVIKLAPVLNELSLIPAVGITNVLSGQHEDLVKPFLDLFDIPVHYNLAVMRPAQAPSEVCARVLAALDPVLEREQPQMLLVQGDTTTVLAGAIAAFHRKIPVGHVEAGMRSGNSMSPFPEEMNRRLATQLATYHFAATARNRTALLAEGVADSRIFVTGNPVVQALQSLLPRCRPSPVIQELLAKTSGKRRIVLTTHRRESFGPVMEQNLAVLGDFVRAHEDLALIFPVHMNPNVKRAASQALGNRPNVYLTEPLGYMDFIALLAQAWLIVSDSGGVQEEAPSLGKPVLVLRENTERPEGIEAGVSRLVGGSPEKLRELLHEAYAENSWVSAIREKTNPFGFADSGKRIAATVVSLLEGSGHADQPRALPVSIAL